MAPARQSTMAARPSGSRSRNPDADLSGLFFGGTELVQDHDEEEDEEDEDEEFYDHTIYDSDADEDAEFEDTTANRRRSGKSGKKAVRTLGGKARVPKPVGSDYGSEDERIVDLKKQGYKDDYIANKLVEEGRQKWSAKRIQNRYAKLKKVVDRKEEERLDDELYDWCIGEDDKLRECFNAAEEKYEIDLLKLKEKKWRDVATALAEGLGEKKYTAKACKERWESLEDGSALIPIELDMDQEGRTALRERRWSEAKRGREQAKAAKEWKLGERGRKQAEKRAELEQRERERQAVKDRKQAEKDEDERIKAEQRAALEKKRAEQRAIEESIKRYHEAKRIERKNADAMYIHLTGKKINGRRGDNLIKAAGEDDTVYGSDSDEEMLDSMVDGEEAEPDMPDLTDAEGTSASEDENGEHKVKRPRSTKPTRRSQRVVKTPKTRVTLDTLVNPRTIMSSSELDRLIAKRNLPRRADDESHAEVVARLAATDKQEGTATLRELLLQYFDRRKGARELLIRRLQEYDAADSELGQQGITAIDLEFKQDYEGYKGKFAFALED